MIKRLLASAAIIAALLAPPARAVIVTGDQGRNTNAPSGDLSGSGWDLQGQYGDFLGTPISTDWFITAAHFGNAGGTITLPDGIAHPLTGASFAVPGTDLVMRQVSVPFGSYATIYNPVLDGGLTAADRLVVFGRGTARGSAIAGNGWNWGAADHATSWGTNDFAGKITVTAAAVAAGAGFAAGTSFITAAFDNNGDPNEATLSVGDSGGGVFVRRGGEWKLVGINYGVDLFRSSPAGGDLSAAIYDARGLYGQAADGSYVYIDPAATPSPVPQYWYASDVPDTLGLIAADPLSVPEAGTIGILGFTALVLGRRRRRR